MMVTLFWEGGSRGGALPKNYSDLAPTYMLPKRKKNASRPRTLQAKIGNTPFK